MVHTFSANENHHPEITKIKKEKDLLKEELSEYHKKKYGKELYLDDLYWKKKI